MRFWGPPNVEKLKARRDVPRLIKALTYQRGYVRYEAARALGKVGDERAVAPLVDWLRRKDDALAESSAYALGEIGRRLEAGPVLSELLWRLTRALSDFRSGVRSSAVSALAGIGSPCLEPLVKELTSAPTQDTLPAIVELLRRLGPPAVERLIAAVADHPYATEVLGHVGGDEAFQGLVAALGYPPSRLQAAWALRRLKDPRAAAPLVTALEETSIDGLFGSAVVEALAELGSAALEPLTSALEHDSKSVRRSAAEALGTLGDDRAITSLVPRLEDDSWCVRRSAAKALLRLGWQPEGETEGASFAVLAGRWREIPKFGALAIEPLVEALADDLHQREAADALATVGDARAAEPLLELLRHCMAGTITNKHVPRAITHALEAILARSAATIAKEPLCAAADLRNFTFQYWEYDERLELFEDTISTSRIAQLARNELRRRIMKDGGVEGEAPYDACS